jgi:hypothetical protein
VDVVLSAKGQLHPTSIITSPRIELQLKASCDYDERDGALKFRLKKKNYDELRPSNLMCPRLLIVLILPEDRQTWLSVDDEQLIARRCAFWCNLNGMPEITTETTTISIPVENRFNAAVLTTLMTKASKGEAL